MPRVPAFYVHPILHIILIVHFFDRNTGDFPLVSILLVTVCMIYNRHHLIKLPYCVVSSHQFSSFWPAPIASFQRDF